MFSNNHHLTLHATTCNCPYIYLAENHHKCKECLLHLKPRIALILCNCVCDQKVAIFCQTSQIFAGRSLAIVKKICEVVRKMALIVPERAPPTSYNPLFHLLLPLTMKISAFYVAEEIHLKSLKENFSGILLQENPSELYYSIDEAGYLYLSDYGAVVFANISDADMSKHLQLIRQYCGRLLSDNLRDDVEINHRPGEALAFGFDSLRVPDMSEGVVKIVMLNLAYSVAMDFYTQRAQEQLTEIQRFTKQMETEGTIHISRKNMVRFIGKALNNKNRIVENLFIFDSPDLAWDDEYLDRIHRGMARTFEIQLRFKELEYNFKVIEDNLSVFRDFFLHRESSKLEWIIIALICIEVFDLIMSKIF